MSDNSIHIYTSIWCRFGGTMNYDHNISGYDPKEEELNGHENGAINGNKGRSVALKFHSLPSPT